MAQTVTPPASTSSSPEAAVASEPKSFWERDTLLGDLGGVRPALADRGITVSLTTTEEGFANAKGGLRRSTVYEGMTQVSLKLDTAKAGLWDGGTFFVSADQIHGRGPSRYLVGNLQTISGIEAQQSTKLFGLYYEHSLKDGAVTVRAGQFGADEEFIATAYGISFVNSNFGFPVLPATDLPNGGPAYPLAAPGVRLKVSANDRITVLAAVFNGNPLAPGELAVNSGGTEFRTSDGVFAISELQYAANQGDKDTGLPATYKLGVWYHSGSFANQNPLPKGAPGTYRGDYSFYGVIDQLVWRQGEKSADSTDPTKQRGIGVFARVMASPDDRNPIDFAASAGLVWKGPLDSRQDDQVGVGVNYTHIGNRAQGFDLASGSPIRGSETVFEVNYLAQVTGWMQLQPSFQYVISPGANVVNPNKPRETLRDAAVAGLRMIVTF
jgi:porin